MNTNLIPLEEVAARLGCSVDALHQRSCRGSWPHGFGPYSQNHGGRVRHVYDPAVVEVLKTLAIANTLARVKVDDKKLQAIAIRLIRNGYTDAGVWLLQDKPGKVKVVIEEGTK